MNEAFLIFVAALLPAIIAFYIIYKKDSNNPEPAGVLVKAVFFGVLSAPLSMLLSIPFGIIGLYSEDSTTIIGRLALAFWGAAIPEECFKLLMLWLVLRKNECFDEYFDGIVYAVCIGMGFAGIENIGYLFSNYNEWLTVGIVRALFSVPGHFFFAILMGYFYSLAHFCSQADKRKKYLLFTIAAPVLAHGLYDGLLMVQNIIPNIAGLITIGVIYLLNSLRKISKGHIDHLLKKDDVM